MLRRNPDADNPLGMHKVCKQEHDTHFLHNPISVNCYSWLTQREDSYFLLPTQHRTWMTVRQVVCFGIKNYSFSDFRSCHVDGTDVFSSIASIKSSSCNTEGYHKLHKTWFSKHISQFSLLVIILRDFDRNVEQFDLINNSNQGLPVRSKFNKAPCKNHKNHKNVEHPQTHTVVLIILLQPN